MPDEKYEKYMGRSRHDKFYKNMPAVVETGHDDAAMHTSGNLIARNSKVIDEKVFLEYEESKSQNSLLIKSKQVSESGHRLSKSKIKRRKHD